MSLSFRSAVLLMLAAAFLSMMVVFASSPARADNCEVTELARPVIALVSDKPYEEPGEESAKPQCFVMQNVVYPIVGCNSPADCQQNGIKPQICVPFVGPPIYDDAPGDVSCK